MERLLFFDIETIPRLKEDSEFAEKWLKNSKTKDRVMQMSLDPDFAKIVAIGIYTDGKYKVLFGNEKRMLKKFWNILGQKILVSFNGKNFDLPVLIRRSQLLGIINEMPLGMHSYLNRYSQTNHLDLMDVLQIGDRVPKESKKSLEYYAELFQIKAEKFGDGSDIYTWWQEKEYSKIKKHVKNDVKILVQLYKKIHPQNKKTF